MKKIIQDDGYKWGLDIFRIICCLGVVVYHVADDNLTNYLTKYLYFSVAFCVPGFFLLSGYLIGIKEKITKEYCERKIMKNLKKLIGYIIFWIVIEYILYGNYYNIVDEIEKSALSDGILPVAWFLFTWSLLLIFSYLFHPIMINQSFLFLLITIVSHILLNFEVINEWNGIYYIERKTQALWLHIYAPYFMVGMCIGKFGNRYFNTRFLFGGV